MKQLWHMIERYYPWLLLLLGVDCFCAVILWISDIQVFQTLIGLVVLTSILLFSAILFVLNKRENTHMELFRDFLSNPTICNEERLLSAISQKEGESVRFLASVLREYKNESNNMADALRDYEEYVEGWAHEAKTPLSLLTMLLDNRNDEISPSLQAKLDYVRSQLQEDVTQMLYYARLKSSTKDYRFEDVNLNDCLGEVLEDYAPLLEEKHFVILNKLQSETVYTDRRGLQFMLGQIVSNAIKYSSDSPMLTISVIHSETADILSVEDNGIGVKKYNLPYIFQKGFTGDSTDSRKKATGMGLYLVKKMADDLNLHLEAASQWGCLLYTSTFEELAIMFEGSTASGAERAYRKAVDKLTELLVAEGALHAVRLKQKTKTKRKKKIAAAIYEYQADCDGEWGEISLDFENGKAEVILLADWDTVKTNKFASRAIAYLLNCENEKLPKETMVAFE